MNNSMKGNSIRKGISSASFKMRGGPCEGNSGGGWSSSSGGGSPWRPADPIDGKKAFRLPCPWRNARGPWRRLDAFGLARK